MERNTPAAYGPRGSAVHPHRHPPRPVVVPHPNPQTTTSPSRHLTVRSHGGAAPRNPPSGLRLAAMTMSGPARTILVANQKGRRQRKSTRLPRWRKDCRGGGRDDGCSSSIDRTRRPMSPSRISASPATAASLSQTPCNTGPHWCQCAAYGLTSTSWPGAPTGRRRRRSASDVRAASAWRSTWRPALSALCTGGVRPGRHRLRTGTSHCWTPTWPSPALPLHKTRRQANLGDVERLTRQFWRARKTRRVISAARRALLFDDQPARRQTQSGGVRPGPRMLEEAGTTPFDVIHRRPAAAVDNAHPARDHQAGRAGPTTTAGGRLAGCDKQVPGRDWTSDPSGLAADYQELVRGSSTASSFESPMGRARRMTSDPPESQTGLRSLRSTRPRRPVPGPNTRHRSRSRHRRHQRLSTHTELRRHPATTAPAQPASPATPSPTAVPQTAVLRTTQPQQPGHQHTGDAAAEQGTGFARRSPAVIGGLTDSTSSARGKKSSPPGLARRHGRHRSHAIEAHATRLATTWASQQDARWGGSSSGGRNRRVPLFATRHATAPTRVALRRHQRGQRLDNLVWHWGRGHLMRS